MVVETRLEVMTCSHALQYVAKGTANPYRLPSCLSVASLSFKVGRANMLSVFLHKKIPQW